MREFLAGMIVGVVLWTVISPEFVGKNFHETYKGLVAGWESVK